MAFGNNGAGRVVCSFIQESSTNRRTATSESAAKLTPRRWATGTGRNGSRETGAFMDQKKAGNSSRFAGKRATNRVPSSNTFLDHTSMMLPAITSIKFELRSILEQYRAFARECMKWANSANTIEQREILLDMATHWAEAGARLDHQHAFIGQFGELTKANLPQYTKCLRRMAVACPIRRMAVISQSNPKPRAAR